jgi:nicotinic acid mononucleotide adenylyltransferase
MRAAEAGGASVTVVQYAATPAVSDGAAAAAPLPLPRYVQSAVRRYGLYGRAPLHEHGGRRARPAALSAFDGWRAPVRLPADAAAAAADDAAAARDVGEAAPLPTAPAAALPPYRVAIVGGSFSPPTVAHTQVAAAVAVAVAAAAAAAAGAGAVEADPAAADEVWIVPCGPRPDKPSLDVPATHRHVMAVLALEDADPLPAPSTYEDNGDGEVRAGGLPPPRRRAPIRVAPLELWAPCALPSYVLLRALTAQVEAAAAGSEAPLLREAGLSTPAPSAAAAAAVEFRLVIGADLLHDLPRWRYPSALRARVHFVLEPRRGYSVDDGGGGGGDEQAARRDSSAPRRLTRLAAPGGGAITTAAVSSSEVRGALAAVDDDGGGGWSLGGVLAASAGRLAPPVAAYAWAHGLYRHPRRVASAADEG